VQGQKQQQQQQQQQQQPELELNFNAVCVSSRIRIWTAQTLPGPITQNATIRTPGISLNFCM
jgi:hypothetical protein